MNPNLLQNILMLSIRSFIIVSLFSTLAFGEETPSANTKIKYKEAGRIGVTRQSLIKLWLADKLNHLTTI